MPPSAEMNAACLYIFPRMKITLLTVGKTTIPYVADGINEFLNRLKRFSTPFELKVVADVKTSRKATEIAQ